MGKMFRFKGGFGRSYRSKNKNKKKEAEEDEWEDEESDVIWLN